MPSPNIITQAPPHAVERAIKRLGGKLRAARLRRNLTMADVAEKIGANRRTVADAENGKVSMGIAVYAGMLWAYGLLDEFEHLADPATDREGLVRADADLRQRARRRGGLDDDF